MKDLLIMIVATAVVMAATWHRNKWHREQLIRLHSWEVLGFLNDAHGVTSPEVGQRLGISSRSGRAILNALVDNGGAVLTSKAGGRYYRITGYGQDMLREHQDQATDSA